MAIMLYSFVLWNAMTLLREPAELRYNKLNWRSMLKVRTMAIGVIHLLALNISSGSIVAGLDAGQVFNTWPLMNGSFVPGGYFKQEKGWRNGFENMANVQFNHRILAYVTYCYALCNFNFCLLT